MLRAQSELMLRAHTVELERQLVAKTACWSYRGLQFSSQFPHQEACNRLPLPFQGTWHLPLAFVGTHTHTCIYTNVDTHAQTHK